MKRSLRRGFSLLEVLLATAILVGSIIVLSELAAVGRQHIKTAQDLGDAQRICQSQMSKVSAGLIPPATVERQEVEDEPGWLYSISTESTQRAGLIAVRVTAVEDVPEGRRERSFSIVRWMRDPQTAASGSSSSSTDSFRPMSPNLRRKFGK